MKSLPIQTRHSREGGNPAFLQLVSGTPAFAGVTALGLVFLIQ